MTTESGHNQNKNQRMRKKPTTLSEASYLQISDLRKIGRIVLKMTPAIWGNSLG